MKKFFTIVLALLMVFSVNSTVFAGEITSSDNVELNSTEFEQIYVTDDGLYRMQVDANQSLSLGRLDIDLTDTLAVISVLNDSRISPEVKESISEMHERALDGIGAEFCTLFSPELLPDDGIQVASTSTSSYYYYNGTKMRTDLLYTYGGSTEMRRAVTGTQTKTYANALINLALTFGSSNQYVAALSTGQAVFSVFADAFGASYAVGTSSDYLEIGLTYDDVKQWTYREYTSGSEDWRLGYCSEKVTITQIDTRQHYSNGSVGKTCLSTNNPNKVLKSTYFDSPWATAYSNINNPVTHWATWNYLGINYVF